MPTTDQAPNDRIALCLSGGGYRASLFHLGALRRLNELGVLSRVDTIASVSGGSILAAQIAGPATDLSDGGDYDNLGFEPVWRDHEVMLVSDAGPSFKPDPHIGAFWS